MKNLQRRNKKFLWIHSKLALTASALLVVLMIWSVFGLIGKAQDTHNNKKIAEDKIKQLRNQKGKLIQDIEKLNTEQGIEENIRNKFGLAKEGEGMVVIVDDKNSEKEKPEPDNSNFWLFLKNWFK